MGQVLGRSRSRVGAAAGQEQGLSSELAGDEFAGDENAKIL